MALVLTRRVGETLYIGDDITVVVGGVHGNRVCLLITAPKHIRIDREEIRQRVTADVQAGRLCECCHGTGLGPVNSNFPGLPCPVCKGGAPA